MPIVINAAILAALFTGYKKTYEDAFKSVETQYQKIAEIVPSTTSKNTYPWLGELPGMREWLGDRVVHGLSVHDYSILNKDFELTIGVPRNTIEDDEYGVFKPFVKGMGEQAAKNPDQLVFNLLGKGFETDCYDGQFFFDADHPGFDKNKNEVSVSNMQAGANAPWFLLDTSQMIKPIIFQERKKPVFAKKDKDTDDNVFNKKQYVYGVDSRCNVGFALWQMAFGSKAELNKANFRAARNAMKALKKRDGSPLGISPTLLVVGSTWGDAARDLILAERTSAGATNTDRNIVEVFEASWLD